MRLARVFKSIRINGVAHVHYLLLLLICLVGCEIDMHPIPHNSDPAERGAVALLKPLSGSIAWNADGNVRVLVLAGASMTPEVLDAVRELSHLEELDLIGTDITDRQVRQLTALTSLYALDLSFTDVSDEAIAHLATMPTLRCLVVDYTKVTDKSLEALSRMSQLTFLFIAGTEFTSEGLSELRQALPNCHIQTTRFPTAPSSRNDDTDKP